MEKVETVDAYLSLIAAEYAEALGRLRETIRLLSPDAAESISYGIPTFKYRGRPLIYFGAARNHLAMYGTSAGTVRFAPDTVPDAAYIRPLLDARIAEIEAALAKKRVRKGA